MALNQGKNGTRRDDTSYTSTEYCSAKDLDLGQLDRLIDEAEAKEKEVIPPELLDQLVDAAEKGDHSLLDGVKEKIRKFRTKGEAVGKLRGILNQVLGRNAVPDNLETAFQETPKEEENPLPNPKDFPPIEQEVDKCPIKCTHPNVIESGPKEVYLHSIVIPCDIPYIWAFIAQCHELPSDLIVRYLKERMRAYTDTGCRSSILSRATHDLLHADFAKPVTDKALLNMLSCKINIAGTGLYYDPNMAETKIDLRHYFTSVSVCAGLMDNKKGTPGLVTYQKIVKVLGQLPNRASKFLQNAMDCRFGPITDLAASVTVENVDYWMGKLKLTTTTQLVDQLFRSPSVAGKCAAIFQLLEIHDLLWNSIDMSKVHSLVAMMYRFFSFLMRQAKAAAMYAKSGYEWVAAKFRRADDEPSTFADVDTTLPETEKDAIKQQAKSEPLPDMPLSKEKLCDIGLDMTKEMFRKMIPSRDKIKEFFSDMSPKEKSAASSVVSSLVDEGVLDAKDAVEVTNVIIETASEKLAKAKEWLKSGEWMNPDVNLLKSEFLKILDTVEDKAELDSSFKSDLSEDAVREVFGQDSESSISKYEQEFAEMEAREIAKALAENADIPKEQIPTPEADKIKAKLETRKVEIAKVEKELMPICDLIKNLEFAEIGRRFLEWIKDLFSNVYKFFTEYPIVAAFMGVVYTILSFCGFTVSEFKNTGSKKTFMGKISSSMKDMYYANRGKDVVISSITNMTNVAADMMGLNVDEQAEEFKQKLTKIHLDVNQLVVEATTSPGRFVNDPNRMFEFKSKIKECEGQYTNFIKMNPTVNLRHITPIWTQLNAAYQKLSHLWCKYMASSGFRREPVVLWLYGTTMIGKSAFIIWLVKTINEIMGTNWETFHICKGPDYWNGFAQQKIIIIDDFASYIGVEGCLDALAVMNLATCAPYNPSLAALDEKGIYANPAIVIVLSNHPSIPMNSGITDMTAFDRRRDIFAEVRWIEHEVCGITDKCEHFEKFRKAAKKSEADDDYETDDFSHLTFHLKNPIVNQPHTDPQGYKNSKSKRADGLYYKLNRHPDDVDVVNWKELAEMVVEKVKEKDAAYQKRLRDKERSDKKSGVVQESTVDVPHWEIKPNILINGPPGCGKSQMFLRFKTLLEKEDKPRTVLHIKTESEFEVFAQNNFETTKNVVIFDDLSTHLKSTLFPQFIEKVKERYDLLSEKLPLWICAANPVQLDDRLESHYSSLEALVMFYRRFIQIDCAFKRKRGISMWKRYSSADIESITEKKLNINDMVSFIRKGTCIQYTYDSLICHLQTFSPKLVSVPQVTELPTITDFTPDAVCKLKCSSKEFVDNFLNKSGSITTVINFMTGEGAEFYSKAGIDKMDIGRKILTTYRNVRAAAGCQFVDMYSFVLEAWTNDYLKEFRGNSYMMSFADVNFFIQTVCGEIQAGIYAPVNPELANMAIQATLTKELIESIDVAQVMIANLPPWFCLAMQCCSQVAKIGMTVVAATYVVRQNTLLFRAQKADKIVTEVKEKYMDEASVAVGTRFENAVSDVNEIPPMYPHSPGHTGTRQHATSVDRDPITKPDRAKRETDTPGKNFSCGGSKQRAPKGGISWRTTKEDFKIMGDVTNEVEMTATIKQQSVLLQQAYDPGLPSVLGAIMPNMVQLCDRKTKQRLCYGLMLYGKTGTTVAHLVHARDIEQVVAIDYKGTAYDVAISKESPEQDTLDFVITTKTCPPYRNIVKHLSCKDFAPQKGASVVLFTLNKDWFGGVPTAIIRNYNLEEERVFKADEAIHKVCGYSYVGTRTGYSIPNINTFDGDCGSVLLVCDPTWSGKVIGIHTAASTTVGYAREIYREQYEHAAKNQTLQVGPIKNLDMKTRIFGRFGEFVIPDHATDLEGHPVEAIGIIKQFIPSTTKLWLGPMPYGPKLYEPSLLSKFDSRSPQPGLDFMYDETMKWARPRAPISDEDCLELDHCFRAVGEHYGQIIKRHGCPIRVLSKTESINKLRGSMKSNPVLLSSSPGYPWNVFAQGGKKRFIEVDSQTGMRHFAKNQETSWLKNAVDDVISDARREEASYCVFKVCLKDELVKLKKIYEEPKTRTIAAAPLHLVIACRMFFHTVHAAIAECWPDVFAKVGIDAASLDWHAMFSRMLSKSERGFAFDFKGWDTCVPPEFTDRMWIFYDAVFSLCCPEYTPEMRSIIRGLYKNLSKFRFLLFQRVYLATGGVASGHPGTAIDNCIINTVNMYFAFRKIMKRVLPEYATWYYFLLFVDHADYGDDIFVAVVAWLLQHYNGVTVSKELEKIGWEVTSADKDKPITESILLWDCEFMSRGFERFYGLWVGPLREQQIVKCTHYVTTTKSHKFWRDQDKVFYQPEILADLAFVCLKEMFLHGEEKYNALRRHFIENFAKLGIPQYVPMYEEAYDNFMGSNLSYQSRHPSVETNLIEQGLDLPEWSIPESDKWNHFKNRSSICFGATYIYNGSQQPSEPTTGWPQEYLDLINTRLNKNFNSVLMNVYPPGGEIPYHRDNEREIDKKEGVACLTIQGDGVLQLRFKDQHRFLPQRPGTLYVLEREYLERWEHCRTDHREETVSLTFRKLEVPGR